MAHIGYGKNEFGTTVSLHLCDTCGRDFTVCPAVPAEQPGWGSCLATYCASYDPGRDVDKLFDGGEGSARVVQAPPRGQA